MNEDHLSILLEEIKDQNKAVLEAVGEMKSNVAHIPEMQKDISELKSDMKTVKKAVQATNVDLHQLENRVTTLEAA